MLTRWGSRRGALLTRCERVGSTSISAYEGPWLGSAAITYVTGEVISLHGGDQR